mgnify:CR=1 FL=1
MLRAWYRFIHEFLISYRSLARSRYDIKNSWIKTIILDSTTHPPFEMVCEFMVQPGNIPTIDIKPAG